MRTFERVSFDQLVFDILRAPQSSRQNEMRLNQSVLICTTSNTKTHNAIIWGDTAHLMQLVID
jgi:hypothetical protein